MRWERGQAHEPQALLLFLPGLRAVAPISCLWPPPESAFALLSSFPFQPASTHYPFSEQRELHAKAN